MTLEQFLNCLVETPDSIEFEDTMAIIDSYYDFTPTAFQNGETHNDANQNNGSCKILALGQLNDLTVQQTLACFGRFYREDVLAQPKGDDHQNIRQFMIKGWGGVQFDGQPLAVKTSTQ